MVIQRIILFSVKYKGQDGTFYKKKKGQNGKKWISTIELIKWHAIVLFRAR
jgi:hypothetical protein